MDSYKLRELERGDMPTVNGWRNDPELVSRLGAPFRRISIEVDGEWFDRYMADRNRQIRWSIVNGDDRMIGLVSLTDIDIINRSAQFHIMIGEERDRGNGAGRFALEAMLHHAFLNLNLNRVELLVLENNETARRLYESAGFVREGSRRQVVFKNGRYINELMYSMLAGEFAERAQER